MNWLFTHPYRVALIIAAFALILGAYIVEQRFSVAPATSQAWGGLSAGFVDATAQQGYSAGQQKQNLYTQVHNTAPFYYNTSPAPSETSGPTDEFDFDAFAAILSQGSGGAKGSAAGSGGGLDAYSFIPGGLISTSTPTKPRTERQVALHEYGNEIGSDIQSFEETHTNMPQVLKDQFEDGNNPAKNRALLDLARALAGIGEAIDNIEAPQEAATPGKNLAKSYREIGAKLALIPDAKGEAALIKAMQAYDTSVDAFIKNYVALATLFSVSGVTFSQEDAGSVFTFTPASL